MFLSGVSEGGGEKKLTRIYGHDEKHIGELADLVRYRGGGRVWRDCYPRLHVSLMNGVYEGDRVRCDASERARALSWRQTGTDMWPRYESNRGTLQRLQCYSPTDNSGGELVDSKRKRHTPHLLWLRDHHMAVHENTWYTL